MTEDEQKAAHDRIFAAILQGALQAGRVVKPASDNRSAGGHSNGYGVENFKRDPVGPCCAVGAGVLYGGIKTCLDPLQKFAEIHGVTRAYARGVSDGFEAVALDAFEGREGLALGHHDDSAKRAQALADYRAGRALGDAVYVHYYGNSENTP